MYHSDRPKELKDGFVDNRLNKGRESKKLYMISYNIFFSTLFVVGDCYNGIIYKSFWACAIPIYMYTNACDVASLWKCMRKLLRLGLNALKDQAKCFLSCIQHTFLLTFCHLNAEQICSQYFIGQCTPKLYK